MNLLKFFIATISLFFILLVSQYLNMPISSPVSAFTMQNDNFILQMGDFNTTSGTITGSGKKLSLTLGQTSPGLYTGTNYKVRAGFEYIRSIIRFAFSISETNIDFGSLSPTNPVSRTNILTVSNGSANGYIVTASENHALQDSTTSTTIPDTTCDDGTCSDTASSPWNSSLTYGFGYRCDNVTGSDCASGFTSADVFKEFTNQTRSATPTAIMTGRNVGRNKKVQITYKVNISGSQPAGTYGNTVSFIATPTF